MSDRELGEADCPAPPTRPTPVWQTLPATGVTECPADPGQPYYTPPAGSASGASTSAGSGTSGGGTGPVSIVYVDEVCPIFTTINSIPVVTGITVQKRTLTLFDATVGAFKFCLTNPTDCCTGASGVSGGSGGSGSGGGGPSAPADCCDSEGTTASSVTASLVSLSNFSCINGSQSMSLGLDHTWTAEYLAFMCGGMVALGMSLHCDGGNWTLDYVFDNGGDPTPEYCHIEGTVTPEAVDCNPLYIEFLITVASGGTGCGTTGHPAVFSVVITE